MTNIAQTVNVLQSLCLTQNEKTILTPTYYVYKLYKSHMGNDALNIHIQSPIIWEPSFDKDIKTQKLRSLQALDASASINREGKNLVITIVNQSLDEDLETEIRLIGKMEVENGAITVLSAEDVRNHNEFDAPNKVTLKEEQEKMKGQSLNYVAPKHSVNRITLTLK